MKSKSKEQEAKSRAANRAYFASVVFALLALVSAATQSNATELKEQTLDAWNGYTHAAWTRAEARAKESPFLRIEDLPERRQRVQAGETLVWREGDGHPKKLPHGLLHDWMGAVFIPNATIGKVLTVTRDYDRYREIYNPAVLEANGLSSDGSDDRFSMLLMQKVLFVTAALKGEYETRYVQVDPKRWYSISQSARLQAIDKFGQPDARELAPDEGPGYIWRLFSITKFEESDDGVYVELEVLGLSRDVPSLFGWLVDPIVERLPRNSLRATLEETRNAVLARLGRED